MIYLDNNATTAPLPEVVQAVHDHMVHHYGNPSSLHQLGQRSRHAIEQARQDVASLLGAKTRQVVFTSGGTESIHLALRGGVRSTGTRRRIVTSQGEHSAVARSCEWLRNAGFEIVEVPISRSGIIDQDVWADSIDDSTALATFHHVNSETGVVQDIDALGTIARERGCLVHIDAVQSAGKLPLSIGDRPVDFASVSAHKFHGPAGIGALYVRRTNLVEPILSGVQEQGVRGGTENAAGIVGMGVAAAACSSSYESMQRVSALRDCFEQGMTSRVSAACVIAQDAPRIGNTSYIGFSGIQSEGLLILMNEHGVCASAGAACSSGSLEPSPVLRAMGVPEDLAHGGIRFSFSRFTSSEDVDQALEIIPPLYARLHGLSANSQTE